MTGRRRTGAVLLLLLLSVAGTVWALRRPRASPAVLAATGDATARAPDSVRIRVEVLNATRTGGLARRATFYLRDRGFDVVEYGTAAAQRETTLVLDRSGHPDWARRVSRAMGDAPVEVRPDSSRYVDVTVLVGRAWRPPAEPFYP